MPAGQPGEGQLDQRLYLIVAGDGVLAIFAVSSHLIVGALQQFADLQEELKDREEGRLECSVAYAGTEITIEDETIPGRSGPAPRRRSRRCR